MQPVQRQQLRNAFDVTLDFETRSLVDLTECGVHRYAEDESTECICLCYMVDDGAVYGREFASIKNIPVMLAELVESDALFHAYNAQFEYVIWKEVCCKKYDWPEPPPLSRWRDTMAEVAVAGYPQDLDTASRLLAPENRKDTAGKTLIKQYCVPQKDGTLAPIHEQVYQKFLNYCRQDVRAERAVHHAVAGKMSASEQKVWEHVALMNLRGLPVDITSVAKIVGVLEASAIRMAALVTVLTGGEITKVTQTQRIVKFIRRFGIDIDDLTADSVTRAMADPGIQANKTVMRILEFRQLGGKSSVAKFKKMLMSVCNDGTLKGLLRYYGAGTGRHAGAGFQPQNLPRFKHKDPEVVLNFFMTQNLEVLNLLFSPEKAASGLIRHMIKARDGEQLIVEDFSSIESRAVCWLCGEFELLQQIKAGLDLYKLQASIMYGVPYDEVTDQQRQAGKIVILACGFAGGHGVYMRMALDYKMNIVEEVAKQDVKMFRQSRPKLTGGWKEFENAALRAMLEPGEMIWVKIEKPVFFQFVQGSLRMNIPSGRDIWYPEAQVVMKANRFGQSQWTVVASWLNSTTHHWEQRDMSGPLFFQNCIQGLCRDILVTAQLRLEEMGYPQHGSIHDEAITVARKDSHCTEEGKDSHCTEEGMNQIMQVLPNWCLDFPIGAKGYAAQNYKKD